MILLHDNVRPHKAQLITFLLNNFYWDMTGYRAHSPNLTPFDYYLFTNHQWWLGGQQFSLYAKVKAVVHNDFQKLDKNFYALDISTVLTGRKSELLASVTMYRSSCQCRDSIKVDFTLVG